MFVRDNKWAVSIVDAMAQERGTSQERVLNEFVRYQKAGECQHFWPDQNTACRMLLAVTETCSPYATVNS